MNLDTLPDHPAFRRLRFRDRERLVRTSELWEAPEGGILYHPGDAAEDLLLLLEGRLESQGDSVTQRWLPGDLWGEERLAQPEPLKESLVAVERSIWLRWSRGTLAAQVSTTARLRRDLAPVYGEDNALVSGLPREIPAVGPIKRSKRIRRSMRPALINLAFAAVLALLLLWAGTKSPLLPRLSYLAPAALYSIWIIIFLIGRLLSEYRISPDAITSRSFDWSRFSIESRHIPMDQVQGVETERDGIRRRLFDYGTVVVKTSALDGELIIGDVGRPEIIARRIDEYKRAQAARLDGRDRESMRRILERSGVGRRIPKILRTAGLSTGDADDAGEYRFRKSPFVLVGRLVLPLLTAAIPLLGADVITSLIPISRNLALAVAAIPALWALYRFEDWRNDNFRISGGYAIDVYRKPLGLKESRRQVELASVQNIRTEQKGFAAFLFRYGDVILVTAGGASDTVFSNVSRPWKVQETLFRCREDEMRRREQSSRQSRREELSRFAEAMDQIRR